MSSLRRSWSRALPAAATVVLLGASGVAIASAAPSGTQAQTMKRPPSSRRPRARRRGSRAPAPSWRARASALRTRSAPPPRRTGRATLRDVCLYYLSDFVGSRYDTSHNDPNLFNNRFNTYGARQGAIVGNNARYGNLNATYSNRTQSLYWLTRPIERSLVPSTPATGVDGMASATVQRRDAVASRPSRCASAAAVARLGAPSLARMCETCTPAVFSLITSRSAIPRFVGRLPAARGPRARAPSARATPPARPDRPAEVSRRRLSERHAPVTSGGFDLSSQRLGPERLRVSDALFARAP